MGHRLCIGNWHQLRSEAQLRWHRLTDDDLDMIAGRLDTLADRLQERYGSSACVAAREVGDFCHELEAM